MEFKKEMEDILGSKSKLHGNLLKEISKVASLRPRDPSEVYNQLQKSESFIKTSIILNNIGSIFDKYSECRFDNEEFLKYRQSYEDLLADFHMPILRTKLFNEPDRILESIRTGSINNHREAIICFHRLSVASAMKASIQH